MNLSTRFKMLLTNGILVVFIAVLFPSISEAIPAFARKTNMACSTCHTAWPVLNAFGRQYKEHGYRFGHLEVPNKTISKDLKWDETLPVSVMLIARPYDKKKTGKTKLRALHEVELMIGGPMGEKFSGFFEIEAEDEFTNDLGLDTSIPAAALSYNHSEGINLQFSYGSITMFDPYNSYTADRRMTRGTNSTISQRFGGADNGGTLSSSRQNVALYGRAANKFFYGVAISGDAGDAEGVDGNTVTARVAFDVMPSLTVGALAISGTANAASAYYSFDSDTGLSVFNAATPERKYSRTGIDIQSEINGLTINAVALSAKDDNTTATATVKNNAFYVQALYSIKDGVRTTWAPLVRYDSYEKSGGSEKVNELTLGLNYYLTENVRSMLEFWSKDSDINPNDDRLTIQLFATF